MTAPRLTPAAKARILYRLRDLLVEMGLRKWREEGWAVVPHMTAGRQPELAWVDDEEHLLHLNPHTEEEPVSRTLLHEVIGHILFDKTVHRVRDEKDIETLEALLWPVLTPGQRKALMALVGPAS